MHNFYGDANEKFVFFEWYKLKEKYCHRFFMKIKYVHARIFHRICAEDTIIWTVELPDDNLSFLSSYRDPIEEFGIFGWYKLKGIGLLVVVFCESERFSCQAYNFPRSHYFLEFVFSFFGVCKLFKCNFGVVQTKTKLIMCSLL